MSDLNVDVITATITSVIQKYGNYYKGFLKM